MNLVKVPDHPVKVVKVARNEPAECFTCRSCGATVPEGCEWREARDARGTVCAGFSARPRRMNPRQLATEINRWLDGRNLNARRTDVTAPYTWVGSVQRTADPMIRETPGDRTVVEEESGGQPVRGLSSVASDEQSISMLVERART